MDRNGFIAGLILSKAEVEFVEEAPPRQEATRHSWRKQHKKLRKKAYFCRSPKRTKALLPR